MDTSTTTIRTRLAAALAGLLVIAAVAVGVGQPASAVDYTVRQGGTIRLPGSNFGSGTVDPSTAGSVFGLDGEVFFTASDTFVGSVRVCAEAAGGCFDVEVIAGAQGSFVPVAAPGPCLLITANPVVDFGNITLGSDYTEASTSPQIAGCAPSGVIQDVAVRATDAQNGLTTLDVDDSCPADPDFPAGNPLAICVPAVGTYSVAVTSVVRSTIQGDRSILLRSVNALLLEEQEGPFVPTFVDLAVKLPSELAPTSVGSIFTFDVVFTAVAA